MNKLFKKILYFWLREKIQRGSFYPLPARFWVKQKINKSHLESCLPLPRIVDIEITSSCNAHCIMCLHMKSKRSWGVMDSGLYKRLIDECAQLKINDIRLGLPGEPLMDKEISGKIAYAKDRGIKNVGIFTNASLLTEQKAKEIIAAGLDEIYISIDGATKETYEKIRKGLSYEVVVDNIESLLKTRPDSFKVYLCLTSLAENKKEIDLFRRKWEKRVDGINVGSCTNMHNPEGVNRKRFAPCSYLWQRMSVLWNGDVILCCSDYDAEAVMGNLRSSGLYSIWTSEAFAQYRSLHLSGNSDNIKLCKGCELNLWMRWIIPFRF